MHHDKLVSQVDP
uniref:Uncharacterized protein n=1 Tax=Anguilla anguilla TaxID=7936 RepID=A0A0E9PAI7_ANGAN